MKYQPLFHIAILHDYYADARCTDFVISPDEKGAVAIRMHRLLLGAFANGVSVLVPTVADKPLMADLEKTVFSFRLTLKNLQFHQFTDLHASKGTMLFENYQDDLNLRSDNTIMPGLLDHLGESVFGIIRIKNISLKKEAPVFALRWTSKRMSWKYLLVTDDESPDKFSIEHGRTTGEEMKIEFKAPAVVRAEKEWANLKMLDKDYPGAKFVVLESKSAVAFVKAGRKNIQLKKDNLVLVDHLPNPRPEEGGMKVIKYLKNKQN